MQLSKMEYDKMVKKYSPNSSLFKDCVWAFVVGGAICTLGQALIGLYGYWGADKLTAATLTSVSLVFLSALLTGLSLYDKIANRAGAGTLVPITGFANAVVSPALEFKSEGMVLGLGAKLFVISGPVIVYGVSAAVIYGVIYYLMGLVA